MLQKKKVKILSHGVLRIARFKGLRTPAEVFLTPTEIEILKSQGVTLKVIQPDIQKIKEAVSKRKPRKKDEAPTNKEQE